MNITNVTVNQVTEESTENATTSWNIIVNAR